VLARALARRRLPAKGAAAAVLFLLALAVRSLYALDMAPHLQWQDQGGRRMTHRYDEAAAAILHGDGILFPASHDPADTSLLARPPGYPVFLAGVYLSLGRSLFVVQLVQNVLGALVPTLVFLLALRLVGPLAATLAGVMAAFAPHLGYYSNFVTPDQVAVVPVLLAALLVAPRPGRPPSRAAVAARAAAAGLLIGLSVWLRPNLLLLAPLAAAMWAVWFPRRAALFAGTLAAAAALTIAPITLRNYVVYHAFVPVSINFGILLWEGLGEFGGDERFGARSTDTAVARQEALLYGDPRYGDWWASPDGIQRDRDRVRRAWAVIRDHPLWFLSAAVRRMLAMVDYLGPDPPLLEAAGPEPALLDVVREPGQGRSAARIHGRDQLAALEPLIPARSCLWPGRAAEPLRPLFRGLQAAQSWIALPLIVVGTAVLCRRSRRRAAFLLAVPIYLVVTLSPLHLEPRFTLPMQPWLFVLAGVGAAVAATAIRWALSTAKRHLRGHTG
jgi:hypothetical protein